MGGRPNGSPKCWSGFSHSVLVGKTLSYCTLHQRAIDWGLASSLPLTPRLSVIVPVRNGAAVLEQCLGALHRSDFHDFECIVADDASTDDSAEVARRHGVRVIRLEENRGPATARNTAAAQAGGELLLFVDADVCVQPDCLRRAVAWFDRDLEVVAVIGSYDAAPADQGYLSQYRNLQHHFVHQSSSMLSSTFWSGFGAIRRDIFFAHGGFLTSFRRPAIEDIEFGYRLHAAGRKVILDREIQVKHLKAWRLWGMLKTDIFDRAIPWTELILRDGFMPADLNLKISQRVSGMLVALLVASSAYVCAVLGGAVLAPLVCLWAISVSGYWFHAWPKRPLLPRVGRAVFGLALAAAASYGFGMGHLFPLTLAATGIIFLYQGFSAWTHRGLVRQAGLLANGAAAIVCFAMVAGHLPPEPILLLPAGLLAVVIAINAPFYWFLRKRRGLLFAGTAVLFHLLYFVYSGVSFGIGVIRHALRGRAPELDKQAQNAAVVAASADEPQTTAQGEANRAQH